MREAQRSGRVQTWADARLNLNYVSSNVGTRLGKIDVVGIQDLWGDLESDTELVAIEVKASPTAYLSAVGQAFAYSVLAEVERLRAAWPENTGAAFQSQMRM